MPPSEVEKLFRAFAEKRKAELPRFTPDGIPITLENKFDDAIYNYLYEYWKTNSGEYDPKKDVIPESEMNKMHPKTKNEFQFENWLFEQYDMTKKEERGYTLEGNLESLWEIFSAADMMLLVKALPNIGKNLVQLGKDVLENGIQFDTSLGIVAGGGEIWNLKNAVDDVTEEAIEKTVKREVVEEAVEKTVKTEVSEEVAENTAKKEIADTAEDLSKETVKKESDLDNSSGVKEGSSAVKDGTVTFKPNQVHHFATDKSKTYTQAFKDIADKYGLDLDADWNKDLLPHQGRHPNAYHDFVLDEMRNIDNIANGDKDIFLDLYESEIKNVIQDNPDMLYSSYWKGLKE